MVTTMFIGDQGTRQHAQPYVNSCVPSLQWPALGAGNYSPETDGI